MWYFFCNLYSVEIIFIRQVTLLDYMKKGRISMIICLYCTVLTAIAQTRTFQYRPYTDLRPMHFGILIGTNLQDIELKNAGTQTFILEDGTQTEQTIVCDDDRWNAGFSVGVLADIRLSQHLNLRFSPTMHFGAKHLTFHNLSVLTPEGQPLEVRQAMKNTYVSFPLDLKFSAERWNNYRPYIMAGWNPMVNLTAKQQEYVQLKRSDLFLEIGLGSDFYLPYFKLIPELKFCYSLRDALDHGHANELKDTNMRVYTNSVSAGHSKMIVLTLYFE